MADTDTADTDTTDAPEQAEAPTRNLDDLSREAPPHIPSYNHTSGAFA